ncbi:MAG: butyrate kinase [Lawsonibacter sp.]
MSYKLLILNPGSTSTKAAVYEDEHPLISKSIVHTNLDLAPYPTLNDQLDYRVALVRGWLAQQGLPLAELSAVVGRGGIIPNIVAGGYLVDDNLADCLRNHTVFDHASNLGGLMAQAFAQPLGIPAYIYDAVTSDELLPEARVTGFREVTRTSFCHVLNARATALKYAQAMGRTYEDMNLVVAHLGGGISISAHSHGRIIDSVSDDAGPFSPDRSGSLNMLYVVEMCYSGKYTKSEMMKKLRGEGGMSALLGTHDCREVERRIHDGDEWAALVYKAQALQIAKGVGIMLGCFTELIDAVILTGGLANSKMLTDMVIGYLHNLSRVVVIPGENEMEALALGALRILRGTEQVHTFHPACPITVR